MARADTRVLLVGLLAVVAAIGAWASCSTAAPLERPLGHPVDGVAALINASAPRDDVFAAQFCGGILVGERSVLTAAHCVAGRAGASIHVLLGADNLCRDRPIEGTRIAVAEIRVHPRHDASAGTHDLAELVLAERVAMRPREVAPDGGRPGDAVAVGWGRRSHGGVPPCRLREVALRILAPSDCAARIRPADGRSFDPATMLCATPTGEVDTCGGDSGGPVLAGPDPERGVVVGITSWGRGCAEGIPGVYARAALWPWAGAPAVTEHAPPGRPAGPSG